MALSQILQFVPKKTVSIFHDLAKAEDCAAEGVLKLLLEIKKRALMS